MQSIRESLTRWPLAIAFIFAVAILGCGDEDNDNGTGGDTGKFGDIGEALSNAADIFIDGNAAIYTSSQYFGPLIVAALTSGAASGAAQVSCLPAGSQGHVFSFNGTMYAGVPDAGVPAGYARFRLYQIGQNGMPNLTQPIGYIDITCDQSQSGIVATINVVFGSLTVLGLTGQVSPFGVLSLTGTMRGASGTPVLQIQGNQIPTITDLIVTFSMTGSFSAGYQEGDATGDHVATVNLSGPHPNVLWSLFAHIDYTEPENITDGFATYNDAEEAGVIACIESGTLSNPVFSAPAASCADGNQILSTTVAERQAMLDGFKALRHMYQTVGGLVELGGAIVGGQ